MKKPSVNINPVANRSTSIDERVVEVWSSDLRLGCLIGVRQVGGKLVIDPYAGDDGVVLRFGGTDTQIPR